MTPSITRKRTILAPLVALLMLAAFVALPASAAPVKKLYTATIVSTPAPSNAGASNHFKLTLTNSPTSSQSFGSADLIIPLVPSTTTPAFTNVANIKAVAPTPKVWSGTLNTGGTRINLRSPAADGTSVNSIPPGQSVVVDFDATATCTTGSYKWVTDVRQSNVFQGPQNDFTLMTVDSNLTTTVGGACIGDPASIAFVSGPSDTTAGGQMANVTVQVKDAATNNVPNVSVSLASAGLAGSVAPQLTNGSGIATFSAANLTVTTLAGPYTMTASGGGLTTSPAASFNITAGDPIVTFTQQPTNTLISSANALVSNPIGPGGSVAVQAKDQYGNPVAGNVTLSFAVGGNPTGATLNNGSLALTNGSAVFTNLTISRATLPSPTSSGYRLHADVNGIGVDSNALGFAIANTLPSSCTNTDCTAAFPNGGTVTAPSGTTLIIENNDVVTCANGVASPLAGTVTIVPPAAAGNNNIDVTFVDTNASGNLVPVPGPGALYPFCKGLTNPTGEQILTSCSGTNPAPCVKSQALELGPYILTTVITLNNEDPPIKH